jgi:glutamine amidotransferase
MSKILVVDYGLGNLSSIVNMLRKIGASAEISSDPQDIRNADKLILPGVGSFDQGMHNLLARDFIPVLNEQVLEKKVPILGICLGQQLFGKGSEEGRLAGLGWLDASCARFQTATDLKIPHMGWNAVAIQYPHFLLAGIEDYNRFYFVHSYHMLCNDSADVLGQTTYGIPFPSVVARNNILGVQFHPEKSHRFGLRLLKNFSDI